MITAFTADSLQVHVHDRRGNLETLDLPSLRRSAGPVEVGDVKAMAADPRDGSVLALARDASMTRLDPGTGRVLADRTGRAGGRRVRRRRAPRQHAVAGRLAARRPPSRRRRAPARHRGPRVDRHRDSGRVRPTGTSPSPTTGASSPPSPPVGSGSGTVAPGSTRPASLCRAAPPTRPSPTSATGRGCWSPHRTGGPGPSTPSRRPGWNAPVRSPVATSPATSGRRYFPERDYQVTCPQRS